MKTKIEYKILFLIILVGLSFACSKDFLVQTPRLSQSNELTLSSYKGLDASTVGAYSPLCATSWYGAGLVITADMKGGNAKIGSVQSGRYTNEYLWNNITSAT